MSMLVSYRVKALDAMLSSEGSLDRASILEGLQRAKHEVIGIKSRKLAYLKSGFCVKIIKLLNKTLELSWGDVQTEICVLLGSFAVGSSLEQMTEMIRSDPLSPLFRVFNDSCAQLQCDPENVASWSLVEASLRAMKNIFSLSALSLPPDQSFPSTTAASVASLTNLTTFGGMYIACGSVTCAELLFGGPPNGHLSSLARFLQNPPLPQKKEHAHLLFSALRLCAQCVAFCARTSGQQDKLCEIGTLSALANLQEQPFLPPNLLQAVLDCLSSLLRGNSAVCRLLVLNKDFVESYSTLLQKSAPETRLAAATCLVHLYRSKVLSPDQEQHLVKVMLPTLIKLVDEARLPLPIRCRAPLVLAILLADDEILQKAAMEGDAIPKVAALLINADAEEIKARVHDSKVLQPSKIGGPATVCAKECLPEGIVAKSYTCANESRDSSNFTNSAKVTIPGVLDTVAVSEARSQEKGPSKTLNLYEMRRVEGSLLAIAAVCSYREECRKQAIDANLLPAIVDSLRSEHVSIRAAACLCVRSLSRSVKHLRTSLVDVGVATPLFELLGDSNLQVQVSASAALCNLVLDFSPMKRYLMSSGGVQQLVQLVYCSDSNLRLNALWGLKNLLFQSDSAMKKQVMEYLTYETLTQLLCDERLDMQEQALNLTRNLACGSEEDISAVFDGLGEEALFNMLEAKLVSLCQNDEIVLQTLYTLVNIATGSLRHKAALMSHPVILEGMLRCMFHLNPKVRVASIWIIINLTWVDDPGSSKRIELLKQRKFDVELLTLLNDPSLDVKERAKTAIEHFNYSSEANEGKDSMAVDPVVRDSDSPEQDRDRPSAVPTSAGASPLSG